MSVLIIYKKDKTETVMTIGNSIITEDIAKEIRKKETVDRVKVL